MTKLFLRSIWTWVVCAALTPVALRDLKYRRLFKLSQNLSFLHARYRNIHLVGYWRNLLSRCAMRTMLSLARIGWFTKALLRLKNRVFKSWWNLNFWRTSSCNLHYVLGLAVHKLPFEAIFDHRNTWRNRATAVRVMDLRH